MKEYQKRQATVKGSIAVLDTELLTALASEGLLALSLQVGLEVFRQMLDTDVEALAGAKGTHNPNRDAYRHGTEPTRVVMGGQKDTTSYFVAAENADLARKIEATVRAAF